jgi:hypothetical protein
VGASLAVVASKVEREPAPSLHARRRMAAQGHRRSFENLRAAVRRVEAVAPARGAELDLGAVKASLVQVLRLALPPDAAGQAAAASPWDARWELDEAFIAAVAALESPRRRPIWAAVAQLDTILPPVMRGRTATILQCALRARRARLALRARQTGRRLALVQRLQRNVRVMLARRQLPRRREAMAERLAARAVEEARKAHLRALLNMKPHEVSGAAVPEEDKLLYLTSASAAPAALARTLLTLCEGDVAKALGLARAAAEAAEAAAP